MTWFPKFLPSCVGRVVEITNRSFGVLHLEICLCNLISTIWDTVSITICERDKFDAPCAMIMICICNTLKSSAWQIRKALGNQRWRCRLTMVLRTAGTDAWVRSFRYREGVGSRWFSWGKIFRNSRTLWWKHLINIV